MKYIKLTIKNPQSIYPRKLTGWVQTEQCSFKKIYVIVNEFWWVKIVSNTDLSTNLNLLSFSSVGWFYTASSAGLDSCTLYVPANATIYYKKYTIQ